MRDDTNMSSFFVQNTACNAQAKAIEADAMGDSWFAYSKFYFIVRDRELPLLWDCKTTEELVRVEIQIKMLEFLYGNVCQICFR